MYLLGIEIKNYKGISAFFHNPKGKNVRVSGKTGQGKTTAISALWEIIKTVGEPIKKGAKNGTIKFTLGDGKPEVIAERHFTPKTKTITIKTVDGQKIQVEEFKTWFCSLGINPHNLLNKGPKDQVDTLITMVDFPDGFDYIATNDTMANLAEELKDIGREIKAKEKAMGEEPPEAEVVDLSALLAEQTRIQDHNNEILNQKQNWDSANKQLGVISDTINDLEEKLAIQRRRMEEGSKYIADLQKWLDENKVIPQDEIQQKIENTEEQNKKAIARKLWEEKEAELEGLRKESRTKSRTSKELHNQKQTALETAQWPLDGLSIQNGSIHFKGIPLSQCGKSEQLLICGTLSALQINQSPLKIVRLDGVESMSAEDYDQLEKTFNEYGVQVLSSRVDRHGEAEDGELLIENGELKNG